MRDFTLDSYQLLLKSFQNSGYEFYDLAGFVANSSQKAIFLRHDIDLYTNRVEKFAKLEKSMELQATYYFRTPYKPAHRKIIATVVQYNHNIGYHYNDLAEHRGNMPLAIQSFLNTLSDLRSFGEVKSICMHGNARSSINNLDLINGLDFGELGLTGDPYKIINHDKALYLSDSSRCWNCSKYSRWDRVRSQLKYHPHSTFNIIADLQRGDLPDQLHICIHPQHYHDHKLRWAAYLIERFAKNRVKTLYINRNYA
ncbi:MAG: hypothetical protein NT004_13450 [Bacteroidetes bacterium]|nr:hypothetical protein [Bacteroidota bacterium]